MTGLEGAGLEAPAGRDGGIYPVVEGKRRDGGIYAVVEGKRRDGGIYAVVEGRHPDSPDGYGLARWLGQGVVRSAG